MGVATWPQPRPYVRRRVIGPDVHEWEAYIPPTRAEHFEHGDVENGAVLGPWGETSWPTWQQACAFMQSCSEDVAIAAAEHTTTMTWEV